MLTPIIWISSSSLFKLFTICLSRSVSPPCSISLTRKSDKSGPVRKPTPFIGENKGADQLCSDAQLICTFVFTTRIVQSFFVLYPKY